MNKTVARIDQLEAEAMRFHLEHPEVWSLFIQFTKDRISRGFSHYSARAIFHRIRWETAVPEYELGKGFKMNDHHSPFYSRWFMEAYPRHDGFFRIRYQTSADAPPMTGSPFVPQYLDER